MLGERVLDGLLPVLLATYSHWLVYHSANHRVSSELWAKTREERTEQARHRLQFLPVEEFPRSDIEQIC